MTKILALGGSVRGSVSGKDFLLKSILDSESLEQFLEKMRRHVASGLPPSRLLSNSEILGGVVLMGAKSQGCEVDFFPLLELFERREAALENFNPLEYELDEEITHRDLLRVNPDSLKSFTQKIEDSDGIAFVSPVYFGDRSSVANKFMQLAGLKNLLQDKVVAAVSVGTKRNGGQETTNIFFLYEAIHLGAFVVGNGPESCQYGGTAWAGDKGKVLGDNFGIETSFGTGVRMAQACGVVRNFPKAPYDLPPVEIAVVVTMDTPDRILRRFLQSYLESLSIDPDKIRFKILELIEGDIERCLACNICPIPKFMGQDGTGRTSYACIIRRSEDSMSVLRDEMLDADGIILAGLNLKDMSKVIYRYQAFMERTRFVRRNDFELTNVPISGFLLSEVGGHVNPIHNLKVMTSFMRHNSIMTRPITATLYKTEVIDPGTGDITSFVRTARSFKYAREKAEAISVSYKALGYGDKSLDHTNALRK